VSIIKRSYWIPGAYAPALSEKRNAFLRLLKNKGFKKESMTKVGLYAIGQSTTLESNKSHDDMLRDVTGVKRGDTVGVSEEPGTWRAVPADLHEAWEERVAIMLADGHLRPADAARLAWEGLQGCPPSSRGGHAGHDGTHA
jgi:hypothetical protein